MKPSALACWASLLLLSLPAAAQLLHPMEPTPFRRATLDGRPFDLNGMSFLHRISYQPMPLLGRRGPVQDRILQGSVGSISGDEFYTRIEAAIHFPLDGPFFAGYRFRRDEDFDGPFEWNLVGIGTKFEHWRVSVWGDIVQDKSSVDLHLDISRQAPEGHFVRLVWILPDMIHNDKTEDSRYAPKPTSLFLRGEWVLSPSFSLLGFAQLNNRAELEKFTTNQRFTNRMLSGGAGIEWRVDERQTVELAFEGLSGDRREAQLDPPPPVPDQLDRQYRAGILEWRQQLTPGTQQWMGLRWLRFEEEDQRISNPLLTRIIDRHETTLYLGREYRVSDRVTLSPNLFLAYHDIIDETPDNPDVDSRSRRQFYGKFAPAATVTLNETTGATLTLLLSARLHDGNFGGGNVQVSIPF